MDFNICFEKLKLEFVGVKDDLVFVMNNIDGMKFVKKGGMLYCKEGDLNVKQGIYLVMMDFVFCMVFIGIVVGLYSYQGKMYLVKVEGYNDQLFVVCYILILV